MVNYESQGTYTEEKTDLYEINRRIIEGDSGLFKSIHKVEEEFLDEPLPITAGCCCPCPPVIFAGPFVLFGPLQ